MSEVKKFGDLKPGDKIMGSHGEPVTVLRAYDEHMPKSMFRLEFDNGKTIEASGNHLWYVETELDRALHRKRLKEGLKLFGDFKVKDTDTYLEFIDMATSQESHEVTILDMVEVLNPSGVIAKSNALLRIGASIGHIVEETTIYQDFSTGEEIAQIPKRVYEGKLFAQQFLSLSDKKHRKEWPLIVGQVLTTEDLAMLALSVDIPEIRPL